MTHQTKTERLTERQKNTPTAIITVNQTPLLLLKLCISTNNRPIDTKTTSLCVRLQSQ